MTAGEAKQGLADYSDLPFVSGYARSAIALGVHGGIANGRPGQLLVGGRQI